MASPGGPRDSPVAGKGSKALKWKAVPTRVSSKSRPRAGAAGSEEFFNIEEQKRSVLFNGTQVLQTRSYDKSKVLAVVVRTGWYFGPEKKGRGPLQVNEYIKSIIRILRKYCPNIKVVN